MLLFESTSFMSIFVLRHGNSVISSSVYHVVSFGCYVLGNSNLEPSCEVVYDEHHDLLNL